MKKKSVNKKSLPKLIKELDDVFQMYVRYRDNFTCITCGRKFPIGEKQQCHAGHFISRKIYSTRWCEENVNCQCASCNLKQSLADVEVIHNYEQRLKLKYGNDIIEKLLEKKHEMFKLNRVWIEDKIDYYKEKLNGRIIEKN